MIANTFLFATNNRSKCIYGLYVSCRGIFSGFLSYLLKLQVAVVYVFCDQSANIGILYVLIVIVRFQYLQKISELFLICYLVLCLNKIMSLWTLLFYRIIIELSTIYLWGSASSGIQIIFHSDAIMDANFLFLILLIPIH